MILFGIFSLVLAGYVATASVKKSPNHEIVDGLSQLVEQQADSGLVKVDPSDGRSVQFKEEQADRITDQQAREGRLLFPQEWYEVAFLAVRLTQYYLVSPDYKIEKYIVRLLFWSVCKHISAAALHPEYRGMAFGTICGLDAESWRLLPDHS